MISHMRIRVWSPRSPWSPWLALAVLASVTAAARTADAEDLVASSGDDSLVIERISRDRIETVYQEPSQDHTGNPADRSGALAWAWSDPRTLWVLRRTDAQLSVAKIVELQAEPPRDITLADFELKREPTPVMIPADTDFQPPTDPTIPPGFLVTKTGQVWLYRCVAYPRREACKLGYLRLDKPSPFTTRRPADERNDEPELPSVAAPPGYTAALKTVKVRGLTFRGAECKGPHGEWVSNALYEVWPPENANYVDPKSLAEWAQVRAIKADWVRTAPPVARFVEKKHSQTFITYVEDCTEMRPAPILLDGGRWLDGAIVRRDDGGELGSLRGGSQIIVAPRR
jgi:hypothetical protein